MDITPLFTNWKFRIVDRFNINQINHFLSAFQNFLKVNNFKGNTINFTTCTGEQSELSETVRGKNVELNLWICQDFFVSIPAFLLARKWLILHSKFTVL